MSQVYEIKDKEKKAMKTDAQVTQILVFRNRF